MKKIFAYSLLLFVLLMAVQSRAEINNNCQFSKSNKNCSADLVVLFKVGQKDYIICTRCYELNKTQLLKMGYVKK